MTTKRIQEALRRAAETEVFKVGPGIVGEIAGTFTESFSGPARVVADENTFAAAGSSVHSALTGAGIPTRSPIVFPGTPMLHTDYVHIERLRDELMGDDAIPVAVGAGTINDIAKRAAYEAGRRYMVVATAASVDGYSSFGSAVTERGFKKTMECPAPLVIVADTDILKAAPSELTAAGYADLASKLTAGADWIIADCVGADPVDPVGWDMVQTELQTWLGRPAELLAGDEQAFEHLFEGLTMSGFAMQALRKSRPASGSDHLYNHIWEMQHLRKDGESISHGFKVAIGTLAATALMETVFARDGVQLDVEAAVRAYPTWEQREAGVRAAFGATPLFERVLAESRAKSLTASELADRLLLIKGCWGELREKVRAQILPYGVLRARLGDAQCPVTPSDINLTRERVAASCGLAQMIRNRYTILDLAFELGWLDECVGDILRSEEYLR